MIPTLEHSWLNILGLQVGTHFLFIFQYKRDSLSTLKKQISLFFFLFEFALQLFFSKKATRLYFIMIIIQEICSQELWSFTSWCCNLFSLSKTVHRPVYLSIWCKNHSAACLPAMHWAAQCAKQPKPLVQLVHSGKNLQFSNLRSR